MEAHLKQGTDEWRRARCGSLGASRVHDIVATTRSGGFTAARKNLMAELVCERLTGDPAPSYQSAAMAYGIETEPEARAAYAFAHDVDVQEVGLIRHPTIVGAHASPDGLVGDGLVEIKCCNTATHLDTLLTGKIDPAYIDQMQFQMSCCPDRQYCDFVSYDKRLPEPMRLFVKRVPRDDKRIATIELEVTQFLIDVAATVDLLRKRYMQEAA